MRSRLRLMLLWTLGSIAGCVMVGIAWLAVAVVMLPLAWGPR